MFLLNPTCWDARLTLLADWEDMFFSIVMKLAIEFNDKQMDLGRKKSENNFVYGEGGY